MFSYVIDTNILMSILISGKAQYKSCKDEIMVTNRI